MPSLLFVLPAPLARFIVHRAIMQGDATTAYRLRIVLRRAYQTIESFDK